MKHQSSIRALALFTCGCLVCADVLEAAVSILPIPTAVVVQSIAPQSGAASKKNATKSSSSRSRSRSTRAKKSVLSVKTKASPQRAATPTRPAAQSSTQRTVPTKSAVNKSSAKRAVARKAAAKKYTKSVRGAVATSTTSTKKTSSARFSSSSKKKYSSRYRSAKSTSKKYARSSSRRHSRKYYSNRRRAKSSSRYAASQPRAVSETVLKAQTSFAETWHETLQDEELMPGVRYKHYIISTGSKHSIHVLEMDRTKPEVGISLWKAQNLANGLESLPAIANRADSGKNGALQGMVNANFWRSYYNTPLGPAVVNGEVLEMGQYKGWSSCFFDRQNRMYIERFTITATLRTRETSFPVETVNARLNPNGVVLYNHFAGKEVPIAPLLPVGNVEQGTSGMSKVKSTDNGFPIDEKLTQNQIQKTLDMQRRIYAAERPLYKATLLYATQPVINEEVVCRVVEIDTGAVTVPQNGVVISFGRNIDESELPRPGDKVTLMFKTNTYSSVPFVNAVSGTPRLVRSGIARHEATEESTSGRNFISQKLPRTAIGTNSAGTMLYFVTTDPTDAEAGTTGMTLQELAEGMKQIGAYHAVNLDGGASASMVVRGSVNSAIGSSRPVSMALGIVQQDPTADRLQPKRKLITKPVSKPPSKSDQRQGAVPARQDASNLTENEQSLPLQEYKPEEYKPEERK